VQELQSHLHTECAHWEEIKAELSELKQNSVPATRLSGKLTPDVATILSQLRARGKKLKTKRGFGSAPRDFGRLRRQKLTGGKLTIC